MRNSTTNDIAFTYVAASDSSISGSGTAAAGTVGAPNDTFFTTPGGSQTIKVYVEGTLVQTKAGGAKNPCAEGDCCNEESGNCATCPKPLEKLQLTYMTDCVASRNRWRVRNPNDVSVDYTYDSVGTVVPAGSGTADLGDSFFETDAGDQTIRLFVGGELVQTKAGGAKKPCAAGECCNEVSGECGTCPKVPCQRFGRSCQSNEDCCRSGECRAHGSDGKICSRPANRCTARGAKVGKGKHFKCCSRWQSVRDQDAPRGTERYLCG